MKSFRIAVTGVVFVLALALTLPGPALIPVSGLAWAGESRVFLGVSDGKAQKHTPQGRLMQTEESSKGVFTTGMRFRGKKLFATNFDASSVTVFEGFIPKTFVSGLTGCPESVTFDKHDNVYVGLVNISFCPPGTKNILKFNKKGELLATFEVATELVGADFIDLASDGCTMFYTSEGPNVKRFNVCTNTQLTDFNTTSLLQTRGMRLLPTGGLIVTDVLNIKRLNAAGAVVKTYDAAGEDNWFAVDLDPDGKSFWVNNPTTSNVYQFDITTGAVLQTFNSGTGPFTLFGVAVRVKAGDDDDGGKDDDDDDDD